MHVSFFYFFRYASSGGAVPDTIYKALQECDVMLYPNIHRLLRIACTLPVTSCSVERSNSVLRRLYTYLRASMGQERLTNLALIHVNYGLQYDYEEIVNLFAIQHPRRMELEWPLHAK